jgi:hypothetical protein
MLEAVEIMLKRMETHPEEFVNVSPYTMGSGYSGKWNQVLGDMTSWATAEETRAIQEGFIKAKRLLVNEKVLKILADGDAPQEVETIPSPSTQRTGTVLGGVTHTGLSGLSNAISNGGTVTLGGAGTSAQNAYQNHLAHQQAHLAQQAQALSTQSVIEQGLSNYWGDSYATTVSEPNTEFIKKLKAKLFEESK